MAEETLTQVWTRIAPVIKAALDEIKEREGIMLEHQIRQGVLLWLESRGIDPLKPKSKR